MTCQEEIELLDKVETMKQEMWSNKHVKKSYKI